MSIEAISWALNEAPIPTDRRDASSLAMVLVGLANHADPDGRNAFPSNATLIRYTRLSERSVRSILRELASLELIHPSDPGIVAAYISRADRRPNGYDLNLSLTSVDNPLFLWTTVVRQPTTRGTVCRPLTSTGAHNAGPRGRQHRNGGQSLPPNRP
jgi:Helix-turn-helix domain